MVLSDLKHEGGKGVLVRNPFDGLEANQNLLSVPASLWVNDIFTPSQVVPSAGISPACPAAPSAQEKSCGSWQLWQLAFWYCFRGGRRGNKQMLHAVC